MFEVVSVTTVEAEDMARADSWLAGRDYTEGDLRSLAKAFAGARAVEREACAKAAEAVMPVTMGYGGTAPAECRSWQEPNLYAKACAHAIRARNKWVPLNQSEEGDAKR